MKNESIGVVIWIIMGSCSILWKIFNFAFIILFIQYLIVILTYKSTIYVMALCILFNFWFYRRNYCHILICRLTLRMLSFWKEFLFSMILAFENWWIWRYLSIQVSMLCPYFPMCCLYFSMKWILLAFEIDEEALGDD